MRFRAFVLMLVFGEAYLGAAEFVGTSPCGAMVREFIGISRTEPCDKITWRLNISETNTFMLNATYGLQEQSAPGYVSGGKSVMMEGKWTMKGTGPRKVYAIQANKSDRAMSILRVNENLLQLLGTDGKSLIGNEFWSYTLNRKDVGKSR
jgi:hypothetical protein